MIQNIKHKVWISATTVVLGLYGFAQKFRMFVLCRHFSFGIKITFLEKSGSAVNRIQIRLQKVELHYLDEYLFALTSLFYLLRVTKVIH